VLADNTLEEQAVPEKALLDQILDAVKSPGAEHMKIYLGMGLVLAIIGGIVFAALG